MDLVSILREKRDNYKVAIIQGNQKITYSELNFFSKELSDLLKNVDSISNNIGLFFDNCIEYAIAYFGVLGAKKVVVPIGVKTKRSEFISCVDYCEINYIITNSKNLEKLHEILKNINCSINVYCVDLEKIKFNYIKNNSLSLYDEINNNIIEDDVAIMIHTSGTTSNPKRVMLTHKNIIKNAQAIIQSLKLTSSDRTLIYLPLFLASANTSQFITHLYLGASIVIAEGNFIPINFAKLVERHKITNFTGVPFMLNSFNEYLNDKKYDLSSLKFLCIGGQKVPQHSLIKFRSKFNNIKVVQMYGQTEATTRLTHLLNNNDEEKFKSVGKAIPNVQIRIVNSQGNDVKIGEIGELIARGDNVMKGYYKNRVLTSKVIRDGWLYTGDLAKFDNEGYIYIVGRKKNMFIQGGANIYPEEIEEIILKSNLVKEVVVYPKQSDNYEEYPYADVVIENGDENEIKRQILEFCFKELSSYKVPKDIIFRTELNKTEGGKVKRERERIYDYD